MAAHGNVSRSPRPASFTSFVLKLVHLALTLALPLAIPQVVQLLAPAPDGPTLLLSNGYVVAAVLFAMLLALAIADVAARSIALSTEVRLRAVLANAIYSKALALSPAARQACSPDRIASLISSDISSYAALIASVHDFWAVPVRLAASAYLLYYLLGNAAWVALAAVAVLWLAQTSLAPNSTVHMRDYTAAADSRIAALRDFLLGICIVKLRAIEDRFVSLVSFARAKQLATLRPMRLAAYSFLAVVSLQVALVPPATFASYSALGSVLRPGNVFAALAILDSLFMPLQFLPRMAPIASEGRAAFRRISDFMCSDEVTRDEVGQILPADKVSEGHAIKMSAASFVWEEFRKSHGVRLGLRHRSRVFKKGIELRQPDPTYVFHSSPALAYATLRSASRSPALFTDDHARTAPAGPAPRPEAPRPTSPAAQYISPLLARDLDVASPVAQSGASAVAAVATEPAAMPTNEDAERGPETAKDQAANPDVVVAESASPREDSADTDQHTLAIDEAGNPDSESVPAGADAPAGAGAVEAASAQPESQPGTSTAEHVEASESVGNVQDAGAGRPANNSMSDIRPVESKPDESKPVEPKPVVAKPIDPKVAQLKAQSSDSTIPRKPSPPLAGQINAKTTPGQIEHPAPVRFADELVKEKKDSAEPSMPQPFALRDITLDIPRGSLVAVVGSVGSGKSSLLSALIGSMRKTAGDSALFGSVAYCAQEPWILTGTVEDNIVFGDDAVRARIPAAVAASCLDRDLEILPNGLGTQIGEKGINLSGGQKARVALARAIARDADIYLLDDPIAALDAHVGKKVFDDAICGVLRGKTVFLVTHQLHLLPKVDMVVVLDEGRVVETGAFKDLIEIEGGALAEIMKGYHYDDLEIKTMRGSDFGAATAADDDDEDGDSPQRVKKAIKACEEERTIEEDRRAKPVPFATYRTYLGAAGSWMFPTAVLVTLILVLGRLAPRVVLSFWSSEANELGFNAQQYMSLYIGLGGVEVVTTVTSNVVWFFGGFLACAALHNGAFSGIVRAPLVFFDSQFTGRVLNRMSADVQAIDMRMPSLLLGAVGSASFSLASIALIAAASPLLLVLFAVMLLAVISLYRKYQASYRELKRLSPLMRAPLATHAAESFKGTPTIAAFAVQKLLARSHMAKIDQANLSFLLLGGLELWLALRIGAISALAAFGLVALATAGFVSRTFLGAALAETLSLAQTLLSTISMLSAAEASFNSVERLDYYAKELPSEAARELPTDPKDGEWPTAGAVAIRDLEIRYLSRPDHAVIQDLSLDIQPGEKVGVVGRPGSGKSTLMTALFRIMEASKGSIAIDGIDIASLGLKTLRSRLQIIPQDPVLFRGTVRSNLGFASKHTDDELWAALGLVGLKDFVGSLDGKLDATIDENGANLSMGQRQLMCLCKAILAKPKVLIMDEGTAPMDPDTHDRIQDAIETHFAATTVLSIAHRLNTIAAFDRVLVLDAGRIAEFDAPHVLLRRPGGSLFSSMVDATGDANAAVIRQIAAYHFAQTTGPAGWL
ncbi:hypothetical protein HK105_205894 [Polyrhizophydium stewartii]|uniref:P-loop containing nucleoside triphosphate hydrolase protein n=1 Tax=Polyrhizophydium stewartii TaxID=2732419 RepID=A0ABR4N4S8_9FUNG